MNTDRYTSDRPILKALAILNVYRLNLYQTLIFMFKLKHKMILELFQSHLSVIYHRYLTRYSSNSFKISKTSLHETDFSMQGTRIWNNLLRKGVKNRTKLNSFKNSIKPTFLNRQRDSILLASSKNLISHSHIFNQFNSMYSYIALKFIIFFNLLL